MNFYIAYQFVRGSNRKFALFILAVFISLNLFAQEKKVISLLPMHLVRYDENYDTLTFSKDAPLIQRVKHIDLSSKSTYLSLGGEVRSAYEASKDQLFGLKKGTEEIGLFRAYLHADLHLGERFRFYGEIASGIRAGGEGNPLPIQEDKLFVHQSFGEYNFSPNSSKKIIARIGRQELQLGSGRILSTRVGPNIRQSFDVARIVVMGYSKWNFSGFYGKPVANQLGVFDNDLFSDKSPDFWNIAAIRSFGKLNLDLYYFGYFKKNAVFQQGAGYEKRHSLGGRIHSKAAFDYDIEALYQFGKFNDADISAYTVSAHIGYTFFHAPLKPRIGLKTEYISGDVNTSDNTLQTFNAMFPDGGYFAGVNALGPSNLYDVHPSVDYQLRKNIRLSSGIAYVWRASLQDGLYNPAGFLIVRNTTPNNERFVGTQFTQIANWKINRYFSVTGIYAYFFAGDYLKQSSPARTDTDLLSFIATFQF